MLKKDVKKKKEKRFKNKKENNKQNSNQTKRKKKKVKMRSLHILFSTILLISHYLHQTMLEIRRCFPIVH